jgi:hypothetical protein
MLVRLSVRSRVQLFVVVLSAALFLMTAVWPEWIEILTGVNLDGASGILEWCIVAVLGVSCAAFSTLSWTEWKRRVVVKSRLSRKIVEG